MARAQAPDEMKAASFSPRTGFTLDGPRPSHDSPRKDMSPQGEDLPQRGPLRRALIAVTVGAVPSARLLGCGRFFDFRIIVIREQTQSLTVRSPVSAKAGSPFLTKRGLREDTKPRNARIPPGLVSQELQRRLQSYCPNLDSFLKESPACFGPSNVGFSILVR